MFSNTTLLIIFSGLSLITGIILTLKGSPYGQALSSIHKIASVISIVFYCLVAIPLIRENGAGLIIIVLLLITGISVALAIVSGAILLGKNHAPVMLFIHRSVPFLVFALAVFLLFFFIKFKTPF